MATDRGNRVLTIAHRYELIDQIKNTYEKFNVNPELSSIGMIQTLTRRLQMINEPAIIIIDEAHNALSSSYERLISAYPDAKVLGFSATPVKLGAGGLGAVFEELIESVPTKWLIENNYLSPYKYYSVPLANLSGIKVKRGEYDVNQLSNIMQDNIIYGSTVDNYKRIADGKKTIVYCISVESSRKTSQEFQDHGYNAISLDGNTSKSERSDAMQAFRDGKINIICNCDLFGEGLDVPDCECVILLRKTKSMRIYIQQAMRSMRYLPDKTAIIIDHVGNVFEHDFPDADRVWSLESKRLKEKCTISIRQCPECYRVVLSTVNTCPQCGYVYPPKIRTEKEIQEVELEEIRTLPYSASNKITTWNDLEKFRKAKKYNTFWMIRRAISLGIKIPPKYNYLRNKIKNM